ncbi:MAG: hypothetical protein HYU63_04880 [Armatimonadetes bacterium]|nr:hypothetical protein [Armatimonadota bacterium]
MKKTYIKLIEGNKLFSKSKTFHDPEYFKKLSLGQAPEYLWIGCSDSRVPANEITPQDLSSTLTLLRLPVTKENLALARILAEHQIPISHENIMELKIALSSFAHPEPSKYQFESAGFLKQGALPVNPKNINALANFFENNPQIGKQFQELKTVLNEFLSANISNPKAFNLFSQIPTLLGSLILNFNPEMRQKVLETLFKITRMVGIEKFQQEASLKDLFQNLKDSLKFIQGETERQVLTKVLNLFGQIEQNISAQALLNQAKLKEDILFYYFQIPFNLRDEIGMSEFKINFRSDSENKLIDPGNFELEFIVKTPKLKKIYFKLKIINNVISGKILTQNEKIARFIDKKLEILKISLQKLSYKIGHLNIQGALEDINLVSLRDFKKIKRINFSA